MKSTTLVYLLVSTLYVHSTLEAQGGRAKGDVSVSGANLGQQPCAECTMSNGNGVLLEYTVALDSNAFSDIGKDFHIEIGTSVIGALFKCFKTEVFNFGTGTWREITDWEGTYQSQLEPMRDTQRHHYLSWYRPNQGDVVNRGEIWKFSVVYCAASIGTDDSLEFILTSDGQSLPSQPDLKGNRTSVPNEGRYDDPGWKGLRHSPNAGFALCTTGGSAGCGIPTLTSSALIGGAPVLLEVENATPNAPVFIAYSLTGPGPDLVAVSRCGSIEVDLTGPFASPFQVMTDSTGYASITVAVPPLSGTSVWLQAFDLEFCGTTNSLFAIIQ